MLELELDAERKSVARRGTQVEKTRCLDRRRIAAPFSLDRISSGLRRRAKPRAEGRPCVGDERRVRRCVRIWEV